MQDGCSIVSLHVVKWWFKGNIIKLYFSVKHQGFSASTFWVFGPVANDGCPGFEVGDLIKNESVQFLSFALADV